MVSLSDMHIDDVVAVFSGSADRKFTNTSYGNSLAINPPYQFTHSADIPYPGRMAGNKFPSISDDTMTMGMGDYYSKAIDDNSETNLLYLSFGVPEFTSLISFFVRAIDYKTSVIATQGRYPTWYDVGNIIGTAASFFIYPMLKTIILLQSIRGLKGVLPVMSDHRYYTMKPTMIQYLLTCNSIANNFATERGLVAPYVSEWRSGKLGPNVKKDSRRMQQLHKIDPDVFTQSNGINLIGLVTRAQRRLLAQLKLEEKLMGDTYMSQADVLISKSPTTGKFKPVDDTKDYEEYMRNILDSDIYREEKKKRDSLPETREGDEDFKQGKDGTAKPMPSETKTKSFFDTFAATAQGGLEHIVLYVEYMGSATNTFSNSTKDIPLKSMVNSIGGSAKDVRFNLSGGNVSGTVLDDIAASAKDLVAGSLSGLSVGVSDLIFGLLNGSYVRFPKMWDDSTATLTDHTFKIKLGGPYGNKVSKFLDMDVVLSLLLGGTLPQSAGHGSYTSPYLCTAYVRGIVDIQLGMITNLSVTTGGGNLGYAKDGSAMSYEVTFTITDMSELLVAPTDSAIYNAFNEESSLNHFTRSLVGRHINVNALMLNRFAKYLDMATKDLEVQFSSSAWGASMGETMLGEIHSAILGDLSVSTVLNTLNN
jgi:hypothetical protein